MATTGVQAEHLGSSSRRTRLRCQDVLSAVEFEPAKASDDEEREQGRC